MRTALTLGYLRSGFERDAESWRGLSLNMEMLYLGNQQVLTGNLPSANEHFERVFEPTNPDERLVYWCSKARLHALTGNQQSEDEAMEHAERIASDCSPGARGCFEIRSASYKRSRNSDGESLNHAQRANHIFRQCGREVERGFAQSEAGLALLRIGDVPGAASRLLEAYTILKSNIAPRQLATLGINLALTYTRLGDNEYAIELLQDITTLGSDSIGERNDVTARISIGIAHHTEKRYSEALRWYSELLESNVGLASIERELQVVASMADALCEIGQLAGALHLMLRYSTTTVDSASPTIRQQFYANLGKVYAKLGNAEHARTWYRHALEIVRRHDIKLRIKLLLEDYLNSGCIENKEEQVQILTELYDVTSQQLAEQSASIAVLLDVRSQDVKESLVSAQQQRLYEADLIIASQNRTVSQIGSYIHSTTLQDLAVLAIDLDHLRGSMSINGRHIEWEQQVESCLRQCKAITDDFRDISHLLYNHVISGDALVDAVAYYVDYVRKHTTITAIALHGDPKLPTISSALATSVYRVVQLVTRNAVQHAQCSAISISLTIDDDAICLSIADDGVGFDTTAAYEHGLGLKELDARVQQAEGTLTIASNHECGTITRARFPINVRREERG